MGFVHYKSILDSERNKDIYQFNNNFLLIYFVQDAESDRFSYGPIKKN